MSDGAPKATSRSTFHLAAGLASGFTSSILLQPADLLKTRVQQSRSDSLLASLRQIFKEPNPVRALWRGTLPSVVRTSLGSAMYFSMLNEVRRGLAQSGAFTSGHTPSSSARRLDASSPPADHTPPLSSSSALPKLTATGNLLSGAAARVSVGFVVMPITVLKVRFESSLYSYNAGLLRAAAEILRVEGVAGFFKGFGATALRDAPYAGLYVLFYEKGKAVLSAAASTGRNNGGSGGSALLPTGLAISTNFLSGALSAALATALTNPPDAVKTRLQLQPAKYRNMVQATALMWREERWRSFFDGLGLRMARKALSSALAWTVYEEAVRWGERRLLSEAGK